LKRRLRLRRSRHTGCSGRPACAVTAQAARWPDQVMRRFRDEQQA